MTVYRCWITYESDHALQRKVAQGFFGQGNGRCIPIEHFPTAPANWDWIILLHCWCREKAIPLIQVDNLTIAAKLKKDKIQEFIEHAYSMDPSIHDPAKMLTWHGRAYIANQYNDLRAFVTQQLNPRLWYKILADEF